jgi:uncharacterized protein YcbK (DUF882 family)
LILTPNFNKKEFASKDGAGMPENVWENIKTLAKQLEVLRSALNKPISITSGFRSVSHNKRIGGVADSQHVLGKASDLQVDGLKPKKVYETIEKLIKQGKMLQGGLGLYDKFVHYDIRGEETRWNNSTSNNS